MLRVDRGSWTLIMAAVLAEGGLQWIDSGQDVLDSSTGG
jgi:hypothetical protein